MGLSENEENIKKSAMSKHDRVITMMRRNTMSMRPTLNMQHSNIGVLQKVTLRTMDSISQNPPAPKFKLKLTDSFITDNIDDTESKSNDSKQYKLKITDSITTDNNTNDVELQPIDFKQYKLKITDSITTNNINDTKLQPIDSKKYKLKITDSMTTNNINDSELKSIDSKKYKLKITDSITTDNNINDIESKSIDSKQYKLKIIDESDQVHKVDNSADFDLEDMVSSSLKEMDSQKSLQLNIESNSNNNNTINRLSSKSNLDTIQEENAQTPEKEEKGKEEKGKEEKEETTTSPKSPLQILTSHLKTISNYSLQ